MSCENCNATNVEIVNVRETVPTIFGEIDVEMVLCKTCKSAIDFCIYTMAETFEFLVSKMNGRANQLNNKLKRTLK